MEPQAYVRRPLPEGPYDLVVIGGGINGVAIARDAVLRGRSVALIEKGDLASGTSSNSSKMIHGGIRYLEQLRLGLVYEAIRERYLALRLAPHVVHPQPFIIPLYEGARRGPRLIRLGLLLYDWLSLGRRLGKSTVLTAAQVLKRIPDLRPDGLLGGGLYWDAVMDDARVCVLNAVAAREESAASGVPFHLRTYCEVVDHKPTSPIRLKLRDRLSGKTQDLLAHHAVRAVGPWTPADRLVRSKGIHLVLPRFPMSDGLLMQHSRDGRVFFLIPWNGFSVIGTTETPFDGSPDAVGVEPDEVRYLMDEVHKLFPKITFGPRDLLGVFAGVRPLAKGRSLLALIGKNKPGDVSRKHRIEDDGHGMLTVFGGKYTTYRAVAKQVVDSLFSDRRSTTHRLALPGGEEGNWDSFKARLSATEISEHGEDQLSRLFGRYGCRLRHVLKVASEESDLAAPLGEGVTTLRAEVVYAVRQEFVTYPEDFLCRRTPLRYGPESGRDVYAVVEDLIRRHSTTPPGDLDRARERYMAQREQELRLRESVETS